MNATRIAAVAILIILIVCGLAVAEIPQIIGYQGMITDNSGNPVNDAPHPMRFRICTAPSGGTVLWDSGTMSVTTSGGVFSVMLGESPQPTLDLDFDQDYWLLVTFEGENQTPRKPLGSSGYAYMASGVVPGTEVAGDFYVDGDLGVGTTSPDAELHVNGDLRLGGGTREFELSEVGTSDPWGSGIISYGGIGIGSDDGANQQMVMFTDGSGAQNIFTVATSENWGASWEADFTIQQNGRVGIGTTDPGSRFHACLGPTFATPWSSPYDFIFENDNHSVLNIVAAPDRRSEIAFSDTVRWRGGIKYSHADEAMNFSTAGSDGRLYIDSDGNVGISTTSPSEKLDVAGTARISGSGGGILVIHDSNGGNDRPGVQFTNNSSHHISGDDGSDEYFGFYSQFGNNRTYDAHLKVYGKASGSWGNSLDLTHDGTDGVISTDAGSMKLEPSSNHVRIVAAADHYIDLTHDGTDGMITTDTGDLVLEPAGNTVSVPVLEITGGSDLSERFDVNAVGDVSGPCPGAVVSIDPGNPGELAICTQPYDRCVAGVVSGAGGVAPGMLMGQAGSLADGEVPVALSGRVYCLATAANGAIQPGDLLTSSDTPGHAMKVTDHAKAQGAIIGKAMTPLADAEGLVLLLVSLQ